MPIPLTDAVIIHRAIHLHCILLAFGLIDAIGAVTPLVVALVTYIVLASEALGETLGSGGQPPAPEIVDAVPT